MANTEPEASSDDFEAESLVVRLAELESGSSIAADATVQTIWGELDTLAQQVRHPQPSSVYESEPACEQAVKLAAKAGQDDSVGTNQQSLSEPSPSLGLGRVGQYQLLKKLGEGGMGAVYKAIHSKLRKVVAIKVLPTDRMKNQEAVDRFEREMVAVGQLSHPNIIGAHDAGEANGVHFLVMEYVDGLDLSEIVKRVGVLSIADASETIRQAAVGLHYAYQQGMVHRDIKPSNLMLHANRHESSVGDPDSTAHPSSSSQAATIKILDMGLALLAEHHAPNQKELTSTGQLMGTIDYMAPEQGLDTHHVDIRADIFSLGASLFKLLTGDVPLSGDKLNTPMKKLMALATTTLPSIATRRTDLPTSLVQIIDRMLAKDPADRYSTPAEVAEALTQYTKNHRLLALLASATGDASLVNFNRAIGSDSWSSSQASATEATFIAAPVVPVADGGGSRHGTTIGLTQSPQPEGKSSSPTRGFRPLRLVLFGGAAAVMMAIVLFFQTKAGVVRVELPDDTQFSVQFDKDGILVKGPLPAPIQIVPSQAPVAESSVISAGNHRLTIRRGDLEFETKEFVLKEKDRITLKIELLAGDNVLVTKNGSVHDSGALTKPISAAVPVALTPKPIAPVATDLVKPTALKASWEPGPKVGQLAGLIGRPRKLPGIKRWQLETAAPNQGCHNVSWSPDSRQFICISGKRPRIYDVETLRLVGTLPAASQAVTAVAWNPVDDWIAAAGEADKIIRFWKPDGTAGPVLQSHPEEIACLGWSEDGTRLASISPDGTVRIWGADGKLLHDLRSPDYGPNTLAWGPKGLLAHHAIRTGRIHIITESGIPVRIHEPVAGGAYILSWHRDGRLGAHSRSNGVMYTVNADGTDGPKLENAGYHSIWIRDGDRVLMSDSQLRVWDTRTGQIEVWANNFSSHGLSCSRDGKLLACCTGPGSIEIRTAEGILLRAIELLPAQTDIEWNRAGTLLAGAGGDGNVRLWKETGEADAVLRGETARVPNVMWSPDGEAIAWGSQSNVNRIHVQLLRNRQTNPDFTFEADPVGLAFSPDGQTILSSSSATIYQLDGTVEAKLADTTYGFRTSAWSSRGQIAVGHGSRCRFFGSDGSVGPVSEPPKLEPDVAQELAWNREGDLLAAAHLSYRRTAIISTKGEIKHLLETKHEYIAHVDWSPDGNQVVTGGSFPTVRITNLDGTQGPVFTKGTWCSAVSWGSGPNGGRIAISIGPVIDVRNADLSENLWVTAALPGGKSATFNNAGQLIAGKLPDIEDHLLYVVERPTGKVDLLRPSEFQKLVTE